VIRLHDQQLAALYAVSQKQLLPPAYPQSVTDLDSSANHQVCLKSHIPRYMVWAAGHVHFLSSMLACSPAAVHVLQGAEHASG
jgi:hypothetical protein